MADSADDADSADGATSDALPQAAGEPLHAGAKKTPIASPRTRLQKTKALAPRRGPPRDAKNSFYFFLSSRQSYFHDS